MKILRGDASPAPAPVPEAQSTPAAIAAATSAAVPAGSPGRLSLTDLSVPGRNGGGDPTPMPAEPPAEKSPAKVPIDFLTGEAEGISWMVPLLLPLVHKRSPARQLVNVVMQLPDSVPLATETHVRLARESDIPVLNRWRRQYKDERGILFDADMDAWVQNQRVFVYELPGELASASPNGGGVATATGTIVAVAKIDLDLASLVEIGGVYTFPEFRNHGYGAGIVRDVAARIRQAGKTPTLQVDEENAPAVGLYEKAGWRSLGKLARVWLTAS